MTPEDIAAYDDLVRGEWLARHGLTQEDLEHGRGLPWARAVADAGRDRARIGARILATRPDALPAPAPDVPGPLRDTTGRRWSRIARLLGRRR